MGKDTEAKFDTLNARLAAVEGRLAAAEGRLARLEGGDVGAVPIAPVGPTGDPDKDRARLEELRKREAERKGGQ